MEQLDIHGILEHLPHRYPFLMVDRVLELESNVRLLGIKNVTYNEPYFVGHFPQKPVMPGVLIMEALAQATGILAFHSTGRRPEQGSLYYLVGIDNARFKNQVVPGDQLHLEVNVVRSSRGVWKFSGEARVDGTVAASADLMCAERDAT